MKQIISLSAILFSLLLITQSCSKEIPDKIVQTLPDETINATVSADNAYALNIASLGDVKISRQAVHFAVSQIGIDVKDRTPVYTYVPAAGFTGTDEVELFSSKSFRSTGGACSGSHYSSFITSIVIKFTITK
jgi:hypothetical protein